MADPKTGRAISQDDWKRTQVRMPQEQYKAVMNYAEHNNLSLNTAMLELMDKGIGNQSDNEANVMKMTVELQQKQINQLHDMVRELMDQMRGSKE